jgi:hypothetical protein
MKTKTIEVFQNDGAEETLAFAKEAFLQEHAGATVISAEFEYAIPGDHHGRWVGIKVSYEVQPKAA